MPVVVFPSPVGFLSLLLAVCVAASGCATLDEKRKESPYFSEDRFRNIDNDEGITDKGFWSLVHWKLFSRREAEVIPDAADESPATKKITAADLIAPPGKMRITWIGHATAFISVHRDGRVTNILTDPVFGGIFTVSRRTEMPLPKEALPPVDLVVVSHSHYDHCDLDDLRFLNEKNPQLKIVLPEGQREWGLKNGLRGAEDMRWWTKQNVGGVELHFLPAQHWSLRVPGDRMQFHWGSYAFVAGKTAVYFAGDTGYASHFRRIAEKFPQGFTAALMPIGAYAPRWFMKPTHIDPPEAVAAALELKAKIILPVHWATFRQSDEKMMEPILYLQREAAAKGIRYRHWVPGESYEIDIR